MGCVAVNMVCSERGEGDGEVCAKPLDEGCGVAEPEEGRWGAGIASDIAMPAMQQASLASLLSNMHEENPCMPRLAFTKLGVH